MNSIAFNMDDEAFPCGFCKTGIYEGAVVCSGCQAEKHVGASQAEGKAGAFLGLIAGLAFVVFASPCGILGEIGIVFAAAILGVVCVNMLFRDNVRWLRRQNTRL